MQDHTSLLGCTLNKVKKILGENFISYRIRDRDVLVWKQEESSPISCTILNGFVISVDQQNEQRKAHRVCPDVETRVFVHTDKQRFAGAIVDFSIKGIAVTLDSGAMLEPGMRAACCTVLNIRAQSKAYVVLSGEIHSYDPYSKRLVVVFDDISQTHSFKLLDDYINTRLAFKHLDLPTPNTSDRLRGPINDSDDIVVVKSDLCAYCKIIGSGFSINSPNHVAGKGCLL